MFATAVVAVAAVVLPPQIVRACSVRVGGPGGCFHRCRGAAELPPDLRDTVCLFLATLQDPRSKPGVVEQFLLNRAVEVTNGRLPDPEAIPRNVICLPLLADYDLSVRSAGPNGPAGEYEVYVRLTSFYFIQTHAGFWRVYCVVTGPDA